MDYYIKSIETPYKGVDYRSRTEARWAIFLEALGLNFTYEPEPFDINGEWYSPDFYLLDMNYQYIEIKPKRGFENIFWKSAEGVIAAGQTDTPDGKYIISMADNLVQVCGQPMSRVIVSQNLQPHRFNYTAINRGGEELLFRQCICGKIGLGENVGCGHPPENAQKMTHSLWLAYKRANEFRFTDNRQGEN